MVLAPSLSPAALFNALQNASSGADDSTCDPFAQHADSCDFVVDNADVCEGGGYVAWTAIVVCAEDPALRVVVIVAALLALAVLCLALTTTADNFFCPSIAVVVDHLKISQNIAGITFMAFGNGAPDVFSTIASVSTTAVPMPGLAIGDLLGGGAFVTTVVLGMIMITKPFDFPRGATIRDLSVYILATIWVGYMIFIDPVLHFWQPAVFLVVYVLYVTGILGHQCFRGVLCHRKPSSRNSFNNTDVENPSHYPHHPTLAPPSESSPPSMPGIVISPPSPSSSRSPTMSTDRDERFLFDSSKMAATVQEDPEDNLVIIRSSQRNSRTGFNLFAPGDIRSRQNSVVSTPRSQKSSRNFLIKFARDFWAAINPIDPEDYKHSSFPSRILQLISVPVNILAIFAIPLTSTWCKSLALVQCIAIPITFIFCFGLLDVTPIPHGPPLTVFAAVVSAVAFLLVFVFTDYYCEPAHYNVVAYLSFVMSVAVIYAISNEIVGIIVMISAIADIPHELLGLTVMAWSNSIGDFIADRTVAKQGFPQMAAAAATGGPLFNLLVGFGITFVIAALQGKPVTMSTTLGNKLLLCLLFVSLVTTLIILFVNKFRATRWHGYVLIGIYFPFLVVIVLAQMNVIRF